MPAEWIRDTFKKRDERQDYIARHLLGVVPASLDGFQDFYDNRRQSLVSKITQVLNSDAPSASPNESSEDSGH